MHSGFRTCVLFQWVIQTFCQVNKAVTLYYREWKKNKQQLEKDKALRNKWSKFCEHYLLKLFTTWPVFLLEAFYASETQDISKYYLCVCGNFPEV